MTKQAFIIGTIGAIISLFVFRAGYMSDITKPFGTSGDLAVEYFTLSHNLEKLSKLDFRNFYSSRIYYPLKKPLTLSGAMMSQTILALPIYMTTGGLLANQPIMRLMVSAHLALFIISFLSFLSMYMLAYFFTRHIWASLFAGIVYTYNPWISAQFPGYPDMLALFVLPLILLTTEKLLTRVTWVRAFTLALLFFLQLVFFMYYFIFICLLWPVYMLLRAKGKRVSLRVFLHPSILVSTVLFIFVSYLYVRPYIESNRTYNFVRPLNYIDDQSAATTDFFFANTSNKLYGSWLTLPWVWKLRPAYANINTDEHALFMGLSVYILLVTAAMVAVRKKFAPSESVIVGTYIFMAVVAFIFALGPFLTIGTTKIPMPYLLLYKLFPFMQTLRVPARFASMIYLSVSVLVAFVLARTPKRKVLLVALLFAAIIVEYQQATLPPVQIPPEIPEFYTWLENQTDIRVIVELPMANNLTDYPEISRDFFAEGTYLFYSLYHTKYLVNGTSSFIPPKTLLLGTQLSENFPTMEKINMLRATGVNAIVVHTDFYFRKRDGAQIISKFHELGFQERYYVGSIYAFPINPTFWYNE